MKIVSDREFRNEPGKVRKELTEQVELFPWAMGGSNLLSYIQIARSQTRSSTQRPPRNYVPCFLFQLLTGRFYMHMLLAYTN